MDINGLRKTILISTFLPGRKIESHGAVRSSLLFDLDSCIAYSTFCTFFNPGK
jgi:hypothetical protein